MAFSASDAALEGFRVTRAHPKAMALWVLLSLVFSAGMVVVLISTAGPALMEMMRITEAEAAGDPMAALPLMGQVFRAYALMAPLMLVFTSVLAAAVYRASARPEAGGFGYLRLGADELRLVASGLLVGLLACIILVVFSILLSIVVALLSIAVGGAGSLGGQMLTVAVTYIGLFAAALAFSVKFGFAGPMTLLHRRIVVFGAWKASAGHFWALAGTYLLSWVLAGIVGLLGAAIGAAFMMAFGGDLGAVFHPDMSSLAAYMTPGMIAYMAIGAVFNALTYTIVFAAPIAAYVAIHGDRERAAG